MAEIISDIGNVREINEDSVDFDITSQYGFYIICDGVGGHNAGEIASGEAVHLIKNYIREFFNRNIAPHILESAIQKANTEILRMAKENNQYKGMGTTITCALEVGKEVFVAHAGDSSAFLIKDEKIAKLTKDHSLVQQLVDEGRIKESEMVNHPNKNIITRSLGSREVLKIDIIEVDRDQFDFMILCTDGLTDYVTKDEMIKEFLKVGKDKKVFVRTMVDMAKERGGKDNVSILIFGGDSSSDR